MTCKFTLFYHDQQKQDIFLKATHETVFTSTHPQLLFIFYFLFNISDSWSTFKLGYLILNNADVFSIFKQVVFLMF